MPEKFRNLQYLYQYSRAMLAPVVLRYVDLKSQTNTRVNTRIHDHSIHRSVPASHTERTPDRTIDPTRDAVGGGEYWVAREEEQPVVKLQNAGIIDSRVVRHIRAHRPDESFHMLCLVNLLQRTHIH